jgi:protein-S-isoprenylcysteine O-methyltransferase
MASTVNARHGGEVQNKKPDPVGQVNAGGIGQVPGFVDVTAAPDESRSQMEKQYLPGQPKGLSDIATRSFLLGFVLSTSVISTASILAFTDSPLWRIPSFLTMLSLFHFLEFWTTARYNTRSAQVSSFLLSQNGSAYNIAHTAAMLECSITNLFFPTHTWSPGWATPWLAPTLIYSGLIMVVVGQVVRSGAMIQAGTNFNHVVQYRKQNEHQLVTTGLYGYLRHPSYFGFFWWGLGTQLVLGNAVCFLGYLVVLWRFFSRRISGEFHFSVF